MSDNDALIAKEDFTPGRKGTLTVVGTGIKTVSHATIESKAHIEQAEKVLYLVADPATAYWVRSLNPTAEDLYGYYAEGKERIDTYHDMVDRILACVREGANVCVAMYGHPGIYAYPTHESVRRARAEGFEAKMLPGICATDCMFADLGFDPGSGGCQMFEATDFLVYQRKFDPHCHLIVWQIAVVGVLTFKNQMFNEAGLNILIEVLADCYGSDHEVVVYQASQFAICEPIIQRVPLSMVAHANVNGITTLYVPPKSQRAQPNVEMQRRLGLEGMLGGTPLTETATETVAP